MRTPLTLVKAATKQLAATAIGWHMSSPLRGPGALILMYHRIAVPGDRFPGLDVSVFHAQMSWLAARCTPICAADLGRAVAEPRSSRPPVLVTFDDGYLSYRELAYPILKELGIPALLFLTTAFIDEPSRLFWWDELSGAIAGTGRQGVRPPWARDAWVPLGRSHQRDQFLSVAKDHLKNVPEIQRRTEFAELLDQLGRADALAGLGRQMLNWADVRSVLGVTSIGGHSHNHPILSALGDEDLEHEVAACRMRILAATGLTPRWFAYPNGRTRDSDDRTRVALRRHGFDIAFTTVRGVARADVDWMALPRFAAGGTLAELVWHLSARARI